MDEFAIRPVDIDLVEEFYHFDQKQFPFPWDKQSWLNALSEPHYSITGLWKGDELIGICCLQLNKFEQLLHLQKICVKKSYRSQGLATMLMDRSLELVAIPFRKVFLEVQSTNGEAIAFYDKYGFINLEMVSRFYSNGDDAFRMIKHMTK